MNKLYIFSIPLEQNRSGSTESSHIATVPTHPEPPQKEVLHHHHTLVTINEHMLTHRHHPQSTLGFTFGVAQPMDMEKLILTCIHHYSIIHNSFIILKITGLHLFSPCPPNSWQSLIFLPSLWLCLFQNVT